MHSHTPSKSWLGVRDSHDHYGIPTKNSVMGHIIRKLDINAFLSRCLISHTGHPQSKFLHGSKNVFSLREIPFGYSESYFLPAERETGVTRQADRSGNWQNRWDPGGAISRTANQLTVPGRK